MKPVILTLAAALGFTGLVLYAKRPKPSAPARDTSSVIAQPMGPSLDANMKPDEAEAVSIALAEEHNPANLISFADTLLPYYPKAAEFLKAKAALIDPDAEKNITEDRVREAVSLELSQLQKA